MRFSRPHMPAGPSQAFAALIHFLARADIVFWVLPLLMINLVVGTLAQASLGIYDAHKIFFSSFFYFLGPLPLPGGFTLLSLLSLSLLAKFLFRSEWRREKSGTILAHLGTLVLLIGGLLTALTAREGFMAIAEGDSTPYVYDYNNREFFIFNGDVLQHRIAYADLKGKISLPNFPFILNIRERCLNCGIEKREDTKDTRDMARFMRLVEKPPEKENEANMSGFTFEISGGDQKQNGTYIAFENMPKPILLERGQHTYKLIFGKEQRRLPFSVSLNDFIKTPYPGTNMARTYESNVTITDGDSEQTYNIGMNAPLRYKGYTFYQSSFEQTPERETTILSVVENKGRIFPYIAITLIGAGLLWQVFLSAGKIRR